MPFPFLAALEVPVNDAEPHFEDVVYFGYNFVGNRDVTFEVLVLELASHVPNNPDDGSTCSTRNNEAHHERMGPYIPLLIFCGRYIYIVG